MCTTSSTSRKHNHQDQRADERFRISEAAKYLSISERHVRRLIFERRLAHFKVGSRIVIAASDCDKLLEKTRREALR
jgi:excisionase family DNA binding protein